VFVYFDYGEHVMVYNMLNFLTGQKDLITVKASNEGNWGVAVAVAVATATGEHTPSYEATNGVGCQ